MTTELATYKGFDRSLKCRGYQYALGQTYKHNGPVIRCATGGFHSCESPFDVWGYYPPATSRFCTVEASGEIARDNGDTKIASGEITIKTELTLPQFVQRAVAWVSKSANANAKVTTGDDSHAASTGNRSHAAVRGRNSIACALGRDATAKAEIGGMLILVVYNDAGEPVGVFSSRAGENGIKPGVAYRVDQNGDPVEAK